MGPLITAAAQERVRSLVGQGVEQGADLVVDGRGLVVDGHENGFFVGGGLFDKVTKDMVFYRE